MIMKYRIFTLLAVALTLVSGAAAADVKTLKGEYTFYGDATHSPADCRRLALEGARLEALAREFGTIVSQDVYQRETLTDRGESVYFSSLSATEVKGEWLGDDGEPVFETSVDSDGSMIVKCTVRGRGRAISNAAVDFDALVLRNGKEARFADTHFRDGDDMYLSFRSPADGYLAVYLVGDDQTAYRLLPYSGDRSGEVQVKHGRDYLFFDASRSDLPDVAVDEFQMTASTDVERNSVYVIFSPSRFAIRSDSRVGDRMPPQLPVADFNKWLTDTRRRDERMGLKVMHLEVTR